MIRLILIPFFFVSITLVYAKPYISNSLFVQEVHESYLVGGEGNDVRSIITDHNDRVYIATKSGVYRLQDDQWIRIERISGGPTYDLFVDDNHVVWAGAWDGIYRIEDGVATKIKDVNCPVSVIGGFCDTVIALGPDEFWKRKNGLWQQSDIGVSKNVQDIAVKTIPGDCSQPEIWIATKMGLYRENVSGLRHYFKMDDLISGELYAVTVAPEGRVWIGSWGGIDVYENGVRVQSFDWNSGLPNYDIRYLTFAPDGTLWAGTALGVS